MEGNNFETFGEGRERYDTNSYKDSDARDDQGFQKLSDFG